MLMLNNVNLYKIVWIQLRYSLSHWIKFLSKIKKFGEVYRFVHHWVSNRMILVTAVYFLEYIIWPNKMVMPFPCVDDTRNLHYRIHLNLHIQSWIYIHEKWGFAEFASIKKVHRYNVPSDKGLYQTDPICVKYLSTEWNQYLNKHDMYYPL